MTKVYTMLAGMTHQATGWAGTQPTYDPLEEGSSKPAQSGSKQAQSSSKRAQSGSVDAQGSS